MSDLLTDVQSVLATSTARWSAIARIEPAILARRPEPGEWSAIECLAHVVDTELVVFRARVLAILEGRDFASFDPDAEGSPIDRPATALAAELESSRPESLATLATLTAGDLGKTARHASLGIVTMSELLNEWAAHDTMHIVQAERALMQPFVTGSGPWRSFFVDHDVEAPPANG